MLVQQPPGKKLGIWKINMGCSFDQGFQNTTETLDFAQEGGLRMGRLIEYTSGLERGYTWTTLWEEGNKRLEKEKDSLFFRKGSEDERRSILDLWRDSDMIIKLTRWS